MDDSPEAFRRNTPRQDRESLRAEVQEGRARRKEDAKVATGNGNTEDGAKGAQDENGDSEAQQDPAGDHNG